MSSRLKPLNNTPRTTAATACFGSACSTFYGEGEGEGESEGEGEGEGEGKGEGVRCKV